MSSNEKIIKSRQQQKTDISTSWEIAGDNGFIPKKGEIIVYGDLNKIKIGDGTTNVNDLSFVNGSVGLITEQGGEIFNGYEINEALGKYSHAEGFGTTAYYDNSHAEGFGTTAYGDNSHAEGSDTTAYGDNSHAEGSGAYAQGDNSHAGGLGTIASEDNQTAIGKYNTEDSSALFIVGNGTADTDRKNAFTVNKDGSATLAKVGENDNNVATVGYVKANAGSGGGGVGEKYINKSGEVKGEIFNDYENNTAGGEYSHAEGQETTAGGTAAHAEGLYTSAAGEAAHAEGVYTHASGAYSHAEGTYTYATTTNAHAEGSFTHAEGEAAHAEGIDAYATGQAAHVEGMFTDAAGEAAHAEGRGAYATGNYSHAGGEYTIADQESQTAIGKYNDNTTATSALFVVGNGTSDTDRKNAFAVNKDGSATLAKVGENDNNIATVGYVKANAGGVASVSLRYDEVTGGLYYDVGEMEVLDEEAF